MKIKFVFLKEKITTKRGKKSNKKRKKNLPILRILFKFTQIFSNKIGFKYCLPLICVKKI